MASSFGQAEEGTPPGDLLGGPRPDVGGLAESDGGLLRAFSRRRPWDGARDKQLRSMGVGTRGAVRVSVAADEHPELWQRVQKRVQESAPEFSVTGIERVQNLRSWEEAALWKGDERDEKQLFHYVPPHAMDTVLREGFDHRLSIKG
jgi:hypothetical protein